MTIMRMTRICANMANNNAN